MKKFFLIFLVFFLNVVVGFSQSPKMQVNSTSVIIGKDIPAQSSAAQVRMSNTIPNFSYTMFSENLTGTCCIFSNMPNIGTNSSTWRIGSYGNIISGNAHDVGTYGRAYNSTSMSSGRSHGVFGYAGNATSGWNYGVWGEIVGANNGSAIYGKAQNYSVVGMNAQFAGFFVGLTYVSYRLGINTQTPSQALDVYGSIALNGSVIHSSDSRLKNNVTNLDSGLEQISKLRPVTYNFKPYDYSEYYELLKRPEVSDTIKVVINNEEDLCKYFGLEKRDVNRKHIGFIAQELREVFPELVYEDAKGILGVDYTSLIPVLVNAIQEQNETIRLLNRRLEAIENKRIVIQ